MQVEKMEMLVCYFLLAAGITQAEPSLQILQPLNGLIKIKGEGKIVNGKTALNINIKIIGNGGAGGFGKGAQQRPGTPTPITEFSVEEKSGLAEHNKYRKIHHAPEMTLDRKMCDEAKAYARKLANLRMMTHSSDAEDQGENLSYGCCWGCDKAQTVEEAVKSWYDEVCDYNFAGGKSAGVTDHFTQVVWKGSTKLGIGRAEYTDGPKRCAYIVGRYKLRGNMGGPNQYKSNVEKGSLGPRYCISVKAKKARLFDKNDRPVHVSAPFGTVDVSGVETASLPDAAPKTSILKIQILNKKKKKNFVGSSIIDNM